jgi:hypothetical protein
MDLPLDLAANSISGCLAAFVRPEILRGKDAYWTCDKCNKRVETKKEVRIEKAPWIMVMQLKRFGFVKGGMGGQGMKVTKGIKVEKELDVAKFTTATDNEGSAPLAPQHYDLYALTLHHGNSLRSGHYTAYVKAPNGVWWHMDDERRSQVGWDRVERDAQGGVYLAWYIRRPIKNATGVPKAPIAAEKKAPKEQVDASTAIKDISAPAWTKATNGPTTIAADDVGEKIAPQEAKLLAKQEKKLEKKRRREEAEKERQKKLEESLPRENGKRSSQSDSDAEPEPPKKKVAVETLNGVVPRKVFQATSQWVVSSGAEAKEVARGTPRPTPNWIIEDLNKKDKVGKVGKAGKVDVGVTKAQPDTAALSKGSKTPMPEKAPVEKLPSSPKTAPTRPKPLNGVAPVVTMPNGHVSSSETDTDSDSSEDSSDDEASFHDPALSPGSPRPPPIRTDLKPKENGVEVAWDAPIPDKKTALDAVIRRESDLRRRSGTSTPNGDPLRELVEDGSSPHIELWTPDGGNSPTLSFADRWGSAGKPVGKIGVRPSSYDIEYDTGKTKKVKSKDQKEIREQSIQRASGMFAKLGEKVSKLAATEEGRMETAEEGLVRVRKMERDDARPPKRMQEYRMMERDDDDDGDVDGGEDGMETDEDGAGSGSGGEDDGW